MDQTIISFMMNYVVKYASQWLMSIMIVTFCAAVVLRALIYLTVNCQYKFSKEFEKRCKRYILESAQSSDRIKSFHKLIKSLLEKTRYEFFELKWIYKRRNLDYISSITDRLFLFEEGAKRLVTDTLDQTRYLNKDAQQPPRHVEIAKTSFERNHIFNKIWGTLPIGMSNDFLSILPGLFIICGIFGTFMGISRGLPELSGMDITKITETKQVLDLFLFKVGHSMVTSVLGIMLSVVMTLINTVWSTEGVYFKAINVFSGSLEYAWNETENNETSEEVQIESPPALPNVFSITGKTVKKAA